MRVLGRSGIVGVTALFAFTVYFTIRIVSADEQPTIFWDPATLILSEQAKKYYVKRKKEIEEFGCELKEPTPFSSKPGYRFVKGEHMIVEEYIIGDLDEVIKKKQTPNIMCLITCIGYLDGMPALGVHIRIGPISCGLKTYLLDPR